MESKKGLRYPKRYPKIITIQVKKVNYSLPKLFVPKKEVKGKKVPDLKKRWYVYFYYRNPLTLYVWCVSQRVCTIHLVVCRLSFIVYSWLVVSPFMHY